MAGGEDTANGAALLDDRFGRLALLQLKDETGDVHEQVSEIVCELMSRPLNGQHPLGKEVFGYGVLDGVGGSRKL